MSNLNTLSESLSTIQMLVPSVVIPSGWVAGFTLKESSTTPSASISAVPADPVSIPVNYPKAGPVGSDALRMAVIAVQLEGRTLDQVSGEVVPEHTGVSVHDPQCRAVIGDALQVPAPGPNPEGTLEHAVQVIARNCFFHLRPVPRSHWHQRLCPWNPHWP